MKFHFRSHDHHHHDHDDGGAAPAHPGALLVLDAGHRGALKKSLSSSTMKFHFRSHDHRGDGDDGGAAAPPGALPAKRPPPPHARPRALFRLGRRSLPPAPPCGGLTSDSSDHGSDDEGAPPPDPAALRARRGGPFGLRRPSLGRRRSLPHLPSAAPAPAPASAPPSASAASLSTPAVTDGSLDDEAPPCARRRVAFATVHTREYSTVLGDHPCCTSGLPLTLGWDVIREGEVSLDAYERARSGPGGRRTRDRLRLGGPARRDILLGLAGPPVEGGEEGAAKYTRRELERAERRLVRDRAGLNARLSLRQNQRFFRAPTAREGGAAAAAPGPGARTAAEARREEATTTASPPAPTGEGAAPMDVSPTKG